MNRSRHHVPLAVAIAVALFALSPVPAARAADRSVQVSLLGGVQALNKSDTALPESFVNVPATLALGYSLDRTWAVEGEFSWLIPVSQKVDLGTLGTVDRKTPDMLLYQANVVAKLPLESAAWSPYLEAGAGGLTLMSNDDPDRLPALAKSQSVFAINFGAGASYAVNTHWGLRADYREYVAFPADDTPGFSTNGKADALWMERGALGLTWQF